MLLHRLHSTTLAVVQARYKAPGVRLPIFLQIYANPKIVGQTGIIIETLKSIMDWHATTFNSEHNKCYTVFVIPDSSPIGNSNHNIVLHEKDLIADLNKISRHERIRYLIVVALAFLRHVYGRYTNIDGDINHDLINYLSIQFAYDQAGYAQTRIDHIKQTRLNPQTSFKFELLQELSCRRGRAWFLRALKQFLVAYKNHIQNMSSFSRFLGIVQEQEITTDPMKSSDQYVAVRTWLDWQQLFTAQILAIMSTDSDVDPSIVQRIVILLEDPIIPEDMKSELLTLPDEDYLISRYAPEWVDKLCDAYDEFEKFLAENLYDALVQFSENFLANSKIQRMFIDYSFALNREPEFTSLYIGKILKTDGSCSPLFLYRKLRHFAAQYPEVLHALDGSGYKLFVDVLIYLSHHGYHQLAINMLSHFSGWHPFSALSIQRKHLLLDQFSRLIEHAAILSELTLDQIGVILEKWKRSKRVAAIRF